MAKDEIYVFYGSQTGQAEAIAETIHEAAEENEIKSTLECLQKAEEIFKIISERSVTAVIVCSTTGDGELPANVRKFMRIVGRKTLDGGHLSKFRYALLGLGDTNYSEFCGGPKTLEKGLKKLGAKSFYPTGYADDGTDMEIVVEPWIEGLWPVLKMHLKKLKSPETAQRIDVPGLTEKLNGSLFISSADCDAGQNDQDEGISEIKGQCESEPALKVKGQENGFLGPQCGEENQDHLRKELELKTDPETSNQQVETEQKDGQQYLNPDPNVRSIENALKVTTDFQGDHLEMNPASPLSDLSTKSDGTLPPLLQRYLAYDLVENTLDNNLPLSLTPCVPYPTAASDEFHPVKIRSIEKLTAENAVKTAFCTTLELPSNFIYDPGNSFGIVVQNRDEEVDWLIKRLKLETDCDKTISLKIDSHTKKKNAKLPIYIPASTTIRHILKRCLEIRSVPKRTFLRALYEHTAAECDKNVLLQLCRKESMEDFIKFIREPNLNIIDILAFLPSCVPTFETLLEHLPRLKARQYSAASCSLAHPGQVKFVFNVVDFEPIDGRMYARKGLCTGYLADLADIMPAVRAENSSDAKLPELIIFKTKNESFRLPDNLGAPIVMVGPGTGVAPYLGFLERLRARRDAGQPETWLFYGCRNKRLDFLFESELNSFVEDDTLRHLAVAFSRDLTPRVNTNNPRYVQDNLRLQSSEILELLLRKNAVFYVCGDARNMAKDVRETVVNILALEMATEVAMETFKNIVKEGRYKEDVWT